MSELRDIEATLRTAHEFITDPALYKRDERKQLANGLRRAARALETDKVFAARTWLRHFRDQVANDRRFAVLIAHNKRTVRERWDSVDSLSAWALEQLNQPHLIEGEEE